MGDVITAELAGILDETDEDLASIEESGDGRIRLRAIAERRRLGELRLRVEDTVGRADAERAFYRMVLNTLRGARLDLPGMEDYRTWASA